jgi:hypothetical protein
MASETDKPIVRPYAEIISEPPTYIATLYPLAEVDWMRIKSVDISSALLGAAVTAILPVVVPAIQYLSNKQIDNTLIWVFCAGIFLFLFNWLFGRYINPARHQAIKRIDDHFLKHGIGASQ